MDTNGQDEFSDQPPGRYKCVFRGGGPWNGKVKWLARLLDFVHVPEFTSAGCLGSAVHKTVRIHRYERGDDNTSHYWNYYWREWLD